MIDVSSDADEIVNVEQLELDKQFGNSEVKNFKKFDKTNYFSLKNGDNVYRVMPPMFSSLEAGHWAIYYAKHFGYFNEEGKSVNYVCLRTVDNATGALTQECPFCIDQEVKKKNKEKLAVDVNAKETELHKANVAGDKSLVKTLGKELEELLDENNKAVKLYNPRNARFWINAMNMNGEFGLLALPKTVYEALAGKKVPDAKNPSKYMRSEGLLQKVKAKDKIDALSVNEGVWLVVTRTGSTQFDTEYSTSVLKEEIELPSGDIVDKTKRATLSDQQKREAITKCKDLRKVFDYLILSYDDAKLVVDGSGTTVSALANASRPVQREEVETLSEPQTLAKPTNVNHQVLLEKFKKLNNKG
jgi:hypothetical protein